MRHNDTRPDTVSATEVASWVYCEESLRLSSLGHEPGSLPVLEAGRRFRAELVEFYAEPTNWQPIIGRVLIALGVLAFLWRLLCKRPVNCALDVRPGLDAS